MPGYDPPVLRAPAVLLVPLMLLALPALGQTVPDGFAVQTLAPGLDTPVAIEFLLPVGLINLPVEWFRTYGASTKPLPLCVDYPVVVRSLDRMRHDSRPRMWGVRWSALSASGPWTASGPTASRCTRGASWHGAWARKS